MFQNFGEGNEAADEVIIVLVFVHLLLGHEDLHAPLTFVPKSVGLFEFTVVEVDLSHKE